MEIVLKENIIWDTTISFSEQSEECQQLIQTICSKKADSIIYESPSSTIPRILFKEFLYDNRIKIIESYEYVYEYTHRRSGLIKSINYNVEEI